MKYAAFIGYENQERITDVEPAHRAYLASLKENGQLWAAGPFNDDSGALIIYEAESEEEVIGIIDHDPLHEAGVFSTYIVRPWIQAL
jgi:uncharacterized protein YciI